MPKIARAGKGGLVAVTIPEFVKVRAEVTDSQPKRAITALRDAQPVEIGKRNQAEVFILGKFFAEFFFGAEPCLI